ncbi:hypothetical protein MEN41_02585 [Dolichospermum sp. ST_con]|nr:hypothetical protein [Dolichospermum sp. ST_con]MDD1418712.1 hypothetical protein [Dolichospermum sp. ST_sed1]MDD1425548.1 hypothetical protein [Dolichospermum sp. ST_sed9]MDD1430685.1 hypothetical protein [Dolichospermum sp. ST_sed6]MDD1435969.1 hypothetical protein [Dolichospermum sp. ST_sed10]MDD1440181.1 hypothetical protein [Dolichospermum sp. ST_sed3]MDD1446279.1 hypothetical protein [Dolichospermum sp. ST_sed8]MDD1454203.1 hypothetical protein [Dolichospermum sp. ST_sed7]MDD145855
MVNQQINDRQQRLENFLQSVEAARQLEHDIMKHGLDAAYLYCDDVEGDWLDTWGDDNDEPTYIEKMTTF